jgi:hypothetical protein
MIILCLHNIVAFQTFLFRYYTLERKSNLEFLIHCAAGRLLLRHLFALFYL